MKEITKELVNAYNETLSIEHARSLRQRIFHELMSEYGAPHFAISFSQTDFIVDGLAKIIKVQAEKNGIVESYELEGDNYVGN